MDVFRTVLVKGWSRLCKIFHKKFPGEEKKYSDFNKFIENKQITEFL